MFAALRFSIRSSDVKRLIDRPYGPTQRSLWYDLYGKALKVTVPVSTFTGAVWTSYASQERHSDIGLKLVAGSSGALVGSGMGYIAGIMMGGLVMTLQITIPIIALSYLKVKRDMETESATVTADSAVDQSRSTQ